MKKIIITFEDGIDESLAICKVLAVIESGRISENKHGKNFCWLSTWPDGFTVSTRPRRSAESSDSFHVSRTGQKA
jgi:hypothetical protein